MGKASGIERLAALYALVETTRSLELKIASSSLREAETVAAQEVLNARIHVQDARLALLTGEHESLRIASAASSAIVSRIERLADVRARRGIIHHAAALAYRDARLRLEQMKQLADQAQIQIRSREMRQAQESSDDRYASRLSWLRLKQKEATDERTLI